MILGKMKDCGTRLLVGTVQTKSLVRFWHKVQPENSGFWLEFLRQSSPLILVRLDTHK